MNVGLVLHQPGRNRVDEVPKEARALYIVAM